MIPEALRAAETLQQLGVIGVLGLACFGIGWLYVKERQKNDKLTERLIMEVSENSKAMTEALVGVDATIAGFKETLVMMKAHINVRRIRDEQVD